LGFIILTYPILSMVNEWWVRRKGMAFGLISAASGVTGIFLPFIIDALLRRYGYRITLRACAVTMLLLTAPLVPLLKPRLPASAQVRPAPVNWTFLRSTRFWIYVLATIAQGFGFFFPTVFLPSYGTSVGTSATQGALLIALMCVTQVIGQFAFGYMSDRASPSFLSVITCLIAGFAALILWGFAKSMALLAVFSALFGFFGFGFVSLRAGLSRQISDDPTSIFATYTILSTVQGVGNLLLGPISAGLMDGRLVWRGQYGIGRYSGIVVLTGLSSIVGGLVIVLFWSASWLKK
jgi:MFS family permease